MAASASARGALAQTPPDGAPAAPEPGAAAPVIHFVPYRGVVIGSADGNYELGLGMRFQFLSIVEQVPDAELRQTFQVRRARLGSTGHLVSPFFKYRLELAVGPREVNTRDGVPQTSPLLDVVVDWQRLRDVNVRLGQYKVPFDRQRIIPFFKLQFIDRALTDTEFTFDRDVGADLHSSDLFGLGAVRYNLGVFTGDGRNSFELGNLGLTYVARLEVFPFGLFDDYSEADFERGGLRASIGAAYLAIRDAPRDRGILGAPPADGGTTDMQVATVDALLKLEGWSILAAAFLREARRNPGALVDDTGAPRLGADGAPLTIAATRDGTGLLVQGGYLLPVLPLELAARYAIVDGTSERGRDGLLRTEEFAGAANYYFAQHQLKLQVNYALIAQNGDYSGALGRTLVQLQAAF